jgi:hypothetical protein
MLLFSHLPHGRYFVVQSEIVSADPSIEVRSNA